MLTLQEIIKITRNRFKGEAGPFVELNKGGSGRMFCRGIAGDRSMVIAHYNDDGGDNQHFVHVANFLEEHDIPAARVLAHDAAAGLIWMSDLGDVDLWAFRLSAWEEKREAYRQALKTAAALHGIPLQTAREEDVLPHRRFDANLYRWEQEYFLNHCLGDHFGWSTEALLACGALPALAQMAERLAEMPRVPVHRDFQSQNVMMLEQQAWLVDYQGLRAGLAGYDVASLLIDPYVELPESEQALLLEDYKELAGLEGDAARQFFEAYPFCAVQRLMQALGAYGNLGHRLGKERYLAYIPIALRQLEKHLAILAGFEPLLLTVRELLAQSTGQERRVAS